MVSMSSSGVTAPSWPAWYDAEGLEALLNTWLAERPGLIEVTSIGQSWQGREIWLATCTDAATGPAEEKPALFVEANIHAAELTASSAALHLLHRLLEGHGWDDRVTRLLRTRTVYVVPRVSPDGAEEVLRTGRYVRSSLRPHPEPERKPGLHQCDIDGDGRSLFMRLPDRHGPWKASREDVRLLVPREPDEDDPDGDYYRLLLEGEVVGPDTGAVVMAPPLEGLDLAANFHSDWPEASERPRPSGPYAGSEPETAALLRAVTDRPNVAAYLTLHTFGAVHLRPPLNDEELPGEDLRRYRELGERATQLTGYPEMSYDELKHTPYRVRGGQLSWLYHECGIPTWITELWNPLRAAGVSGFHPSRWLVDHPVDDDLALLRWNDRELGGKGFVDWYPFDHPQLGKVELGGWDLVHYWYNPPADAVEAEVAGNTEWAIFLTLSSPLLEVVSAGSEWLTEDVHRVRLVVGNNGWLPTHATDKARERRQTPPVTATIGLPEGAELLASPDAGAETIDLGHLAGRSGAHTSTTWWGHEAGTPDRAVAEWLVRATSGTVLALTARQPRAGVARTEVTLTATRDTVNPSERS